MLAVSFFGDDPTPTLRAEAQAGLSVVPKARPHTRAVLFSLDRAPGMGCFRRREFLASLGGAAAWPLAAHAQQGDRIRRIGVLMFGDEHDPVWKPRLSGFAQALAALGWADGRNVRMELRWYGDDTNRIRALAHQARCQRHRPAA